MNRSNHHPIEPIRIERPSFADLTSVAELARLAEEAGWLLVQVPTVETIGGDGKRSDETREERERLIRELRVLLPTHQVWDGAFLPDTASFPAARSKEVGTRIAGMARFCMRRTVTEEALEEHLDLLTSAVVEYRALANTLMRRLAGQLGVDVAEFAADDSWHHHQQVGQFLQREGSATTDGPWHYFFHGRDCAFTSAATRITVEARLGYGPVCGEDFGVFDPGFFVSFIDSCVPHRPDYRPFADMLRGWSENARLALQFLERRGILRHVSSGAVNENDWVMVQGTGG